MTIPAFTRNRFTLAAYLLLGFYAYMQTSLGPIMPFVRADLSLNYTVTGFHLTGFAVGMVLAGLTGANVAQRFGRKRIFWGGGLGMCVGALLLMIAPIAPLTITGAFLMGWLGTYLLVMIQATLADEHLDNSAIALTESNIVASVFAACVPILVGIGAASGITWRLALIMGIIVWLSMFVANREVSVPVAHTDTSSDDSSKQLPLLFWLYLPVVFFGVAMEWCVIFWSADFLDKVVQMPTEQAATVTSVFLVAIIIGRVVASRLTRRYKPQQLLWVAIALVALGFPMFWLGQMEIVNVIGLFITGLGIANLFPLGLAIASRVGRNASDLASSRISTSSGSAILIIPQVLGSAADVVGIFNAFAIVPVFLITLTVVLAIANYQHKRLSQ